MMILNSGVGEVCSKSLGLQEIKGVNPKGNQPWLFIRRTDAEAEAQVLWPPDVKSQHIGKDSDAGKDWRQEEMGMTEDEMVGWHRRLRGCEFEQAPGDDEGQGRLLCCSPWGRGVEYNWVTEQQQQESQTPYKDLGLLLMNSLPCLLHCLKKSWHSSWFSALFSFTPLKLNRYPGRGKETAENMGVMERRCTGQTHKQACVT